jgi:hypothetical protein
MAFQNRIRGIPPTERQILKNLKHRMDYFIMKNRYSRVDEIVALSSATTVTVVFSRREGHDTNRAATRRVLPSSLHLATTPKKTARTTRGRTAKAPVTKRNDGGPAKKHPHLAPANKFENKKYH